MSWTKCIVAYCTFEGTNEVRGVFGDAFFYCDRHLARLGLDEASSLPCDPA